MYAYTELKIPKLSEYLLFQDTDLSVGGSLAGTTPVPQGFHLDWFCRIRVDTAEIDSL